MEVRLPLGTSLENVVPRFCDHFLIQTLGEPNYAGITRKGYVALATHGRVALILRMNGSDRM